MAVSIDQHRGGVEEVHAVLEQDAAADRVVPEPVPGGQVFVGGVVLEREPLHRTEQARPRAGGASAASTGL